MGYFRTIYSFNLRHHSNSFKYFSTFYRQFNGVLYTGLILCGRTEIDILKEIQTQLNPLGFGYF